MLPGCQLAYRYQLDNSPNTCQVNAHPAPIHVFQLLYPNRASSRYPIEARRLTSPTVSPESDKPPIPIGPRKGPDRQDTKQNKAKQQSNVQSSCQHDRNASTTPPTLRPNTPTRRLLPQPQILAFIHDISAVAPSFALFQRAYGVRPVTISWVFIDIRGVCSDLWLYFCVSG